MDRCPGHSVRLLPVALPIAIGLAALGVASSPVGAAAAPPPPPTAAPVPPAAAAQAPPVKDPKAMALLQRSAAAVKALSTFSVHADASQDEVVRDGFKLQRLMTEDIVVQKPGRMRAEVTGDSGKRVFVDDGRHLTVFAGPENYYAQVPGGPTIKETLDTVTSRYDLELPLTDLLYMASGDSIGENVVEAGVIGPSRVGDVMCDHVAFRSPTVDWQLWVSRRDQLPRKIVITTRDDPKAPQYEAVLDWDPAPRVSDATFAFTPPPGAKPMRILAADATPAPRAP